jgi:hypothetical protein
MTSRNLNLTWRAVVFTQYEADLDADAPFPIRYLINAGQRHRDIFITIPQKIPVQALRQSIFTFFAAVHTSDDPTYDDENISVRPRKSPAMTTTTTRIEGEDERDDEVLEESHDEGSAIDASS